MNKFIFTFAILLSSQVFAQSTQPPELASPSPQTSRVEAAAPNANDGGIVLFTPPTGWHQADNSALPPHIKLMVVGKGPSAFPPSMNLNVQSFSGTLKQYLKIVKDTNDSQGYEWKDLGTIRTEAGNASLSQFDHKSQWGEIRMMQVILIKNGMVYILSASALKDEFSLFYKDFFASMRSMRVAKTPFDMINSSQQKTQLRTAVQNVQNQWQTLLAKSKAENPDSNLDVLKKTLFESKDFQATVWTPFKEMLSQKFGMMGADWQAIVLQTTQKELFELQLK